MATELHPMPELGPDAFFLVVDGVPKGVVFNPAPVNATPEANPTPEVTTEAFTATQEAAPETEK